MEDTMSEADSEVTRLTVELDRLRERETRVRALIETWRAEAIILRQIEDDPLAADQAEAFTLRMAVSQSADELEAALFDAQLTSEEPNE
jgi:hypothetical protein